MTATPPTAELLRRARKRIEKPEYWTRRAFARKANHHVCGTRDPKASKWCAWGALQVESDDPRARLNALNKLTEAAGWPSTFAAFNDTHTHAEVLAAFDRAIALAERAASGDEHE